MNILVPASDIVILKRGIEQALQKNDRINWSFLNYLFTSTYCNTIWFLGL